MRHLLLALLLASASLGAAGCSEYHYYDVDVTFDTSSGQFAGINEISTIQVMVMGVSGADTGAIQIGPNANGLPLVTGSHLGVFEYSTFADSGQLTFNVRAYDDATSNPDCQTGLGMKTVEASSMITNTVMLTVMKTGVGCSAP
jgi:hypothetical protein